MGSREDRDLGVASLAGAGLALVLARLNEPNRALWHATALGLGAYGAWKLGTAGLEGFFERLFGMAKEAKRELVGDPPPETSQEVERNPPPAPPNPNATFRGPAIVGRFLNPPHGGEVEVAPWNSTYPVLLELQNVGDEALEGPVELEVQEEPRFSAGAGWTQIGDARFTLVPGGKRRLVTINVQTRSRWSPSVTVRATARFAGHWIATASWTLE